VRQRHLIAFALLLALAATPAAAGSLTREVTRMPPLVLDSEQSEFSMSQTEYHLAAGKYYRWKITSSGKREYNIIAPELWRNCWISQVKVGDKEIKVPAVDELDFDGAGDRSISSRSSPAPTSSARAVSRRAAWSARSSSNERAQNPWIA
jgi:hypothetical protein